MSTHDDLVILKHELAKAKEKIREIERDRAELGSRYQDSIDQIKSRNGEAQFNCPRCGQSIVIEIQEASQ